MAQIAGSAFLIKDAEVTLGADDFSLMVSSVELQPNTPTATFVPVNGPAQNLSGFASWVLALGFGQDHKTAKSLSNYLFDNEGTVVDYTVRPQAGGPGFKGKVTLAVAAIGGAGGATASATVNLQTTGKPARVAASA